MSDFQNAKPLYLDDLDQDLFNQEINELCEEYPFTKIIYSIPLAKSAVSYLKIVAVNKKNILSINGIPEDYLGKYSKLIYVIIPKNYHSNGCLVYGAKWDSLDRIPTDDLHIYRNGDKSGFHQMCVGVPESFANFRNPILECVRTAERILIAYELFLTGVNSSIDLIAYSHGENGRNEYVRRTKKYRTK